MTKAREGEGKINQRTYAMCLAHSRFSTEIFLGGIFPSSLDEVPFGHYPLAVKTVLRKYR